MIFLLDARDPRTVRDWLASDRGKPIADRVRVVTYQELMRRPRLPAETCIFGDLETISPALRRVAEAAWDALGSAGVRRLNDPRKVSGRHELLRRLHALGRSDFRAYRLDELPASLRFPVFVRREREHDGALTELLPDEAALRTALRRLAWPRTRHRRDDLLVVEYRDSSAVDGRHVRLAALRIGDAIIPRYYTFSHHWMVKTDRRLVEPTLAAVEHEYVTKNPHREWIRETFEIAEIDYGRIDYGLVEARPQAWEINTNPSLGRRVRSSARTRAITPEQRALQEPSLSFAHAATRSALLELDATSRPQDSVTVSVEPALRWRYHGERLVRLADKVWRASSAMTLGAAMRTREAAPRSA
jgi:hypothetical protein